MVQSIETIHTFNKENFVPKEVVIYFDLTDTHKEMLYCVKNKIKKGIFSRANNNRLGQLIKYEYLKYDLSVYPNELIITSKGIYAIRNYKYTPSPSKKGYLS